MKLKKRVTSVPRVKATIISPAVFYEWNGVNKKKGGQVKMERVMSEEKFKEWESFVTKN